MTLINYDKRVKVTGWWAYNLINPIDKDINDYRSGHYKSFGPNNDVYIPKTTNQEVAQKPKVFDERGRMQDSTVFSTYPLKASIIRQLQFKEETVKKKKLQTWYQMTYNETAEDSFKPTSPDRWCINNTEELDPLMNRKPKNSFIMDPASDNKFMDDHWQTPSKGRKRINFLRQLRSQNGFRFEDL